jgi:hypothetical protein
MDAFLNRGVLVCQRRDDPRGLQLVERFYQPVFRPEYLMAAVLTQLGEIRHDIVFRVEDEITKTLGNRLFIIRRDETVPLGQFRHNTFGYSLLHRKPRSEEFR